MARGAGLDTNFHANKGYKAVFWFINRGRIHHIRPRIPLRNHNLFRSHRHSRCGSQRASQRLTS